MKEFQAVFQLSKTIIFEVRYYTLSTNSRPYFSTTAARFCRNKRDYSQCGQAQDTLTRGFFDLSPLLAEVGQAPFIRLDPGTV